jgi:Mg-chelatase subunit ChlD
MTNLSTALERALPIVAAAYGDQFGVDVVLSGSDAFTNGKTIVLPLVKDARNLSDVLFGYLAHEAAHVRESDFETFSNECRNPTEKFCCNLIEDVRIERIIEDLFPGTRNTLNASWTYIIEHGMSPPATPEDNEASQLLQYLLHRLMSEVLKREASIPLAEQSKDVVEQTFPAGFFIRLDGLLAKYLDKLTSTKDSLNLARAIISSLKDAEKEDTENSKDQSDKKDGNKSSNDDQNHSSKGDGNCTESESERNCSKSESDSQQPNADPQARNAQGSSDISGGDGSNSPLDNKEPGSDASLHAKLTSETSLPKDANEQLREALSDQAKQDNDGRNFSIHSSGVGSDSCNNGDKSTLATGILASSAIRSRLIGLLQSKARQQQWLHTSGKRINGNRLCRLPTGDSRVFIKRDEMQRPETSVHVLLDCSGSMNAKQVIANQATVSLALAVSTIPKCDIATSMFPGIGGEVSPILHRGQSVRASMGRFAVRSAGGTPLAEAMLYALRELAASRKQRKVLIIVTDGQPNDGHAVRYMNDLSKTHVDTYAIGIGSKAVSTYFQNWSVINDVSELQNALFTVAGQFLDLN